MPTIWAKDQDTWQPLAPGGFPDEAALHDLVENAPQLLPLSGQPQVVILGREVQLGSGRADLVGVEPNGRLVIVEVKLKNNPESRRAIVSQVLSYAAYLHGETIRSLMGTVLSYHLSQRDYTDIADAMRQNYQEGDFDEDAFLHDLEANLSDGAFRLVLVLDEAPTELVQLAGYLEVIASELVIDLITVEAYELDGRTLMAPQRVDPEHVERTPARPIAASGSRQGFVSEGIEDFEQAIEGAPEEHQKVFRELVAWAKDLAADGLARIGTYHSVKPGQLSLLPRLRDTGSGLITIFNENGVPSVAFWRSAFETRAPDSLEMVERLASPAQVGQGTRTRSPTPELMTAIRSAYEEAVASAGTGRTLDKDLARRIVAAIPAGRWLSYGDVAQVAVGSRTGAQPIGSFLASDPTVSGESVQRVLTEEGKVSAGFRGTIGGPAEARAQLEREGITFDSQDRASDARPDPRCRPGDRGSVERQRRRLRTQKLIVKDESMAWGEPWTFDELAAAVAAYDEMLTSELAGSSYVKAHIRERYLAGPLDGRTKRSFEERMGNISAVRLKMGLPIIAGYKPKEHVGDVRARQIQEIISSR